MDAALQQANDLLAAHALAAVRLARWDPDIASVHLEVFNVDWPAMVFGVLVFRDVSYVQLPVRTSWGYAIRIGSRDALPLVTDLEPSDAVFELFARDGAEPSAYVIARAIEVER